MTSLIRFRDADKPNFYHSCFPEKTHLIMCDAASSPDLRLTRVRLLRNLANSERGSKVGASLSRHPNELVLLSDDPTKHNDKHMSEPNGADDNNPSERLHNVKT